MEENIIVINADFGETRVAVIEKGMIVELLLERHSQRSIVGNIYRGRVSRVLPGMQAAFVDVGLEKGGFLHVSDTGSALDGEVDIEGSGQGEKVQSVKRGRKSIRDLVKEGETIVVQAYKAPISTKGCRVTEQISIPGRHLVYLPNSDHSGISRRITDEKERRRLGKILKRIAPPTGALIARTATEGASADALSADSCYLYDIWTEIKRRNTEGKKPGLLYEDLDLPLRVARDRFNDSISKLVVDNAEIHEKLKSFVDRLIPIMLDRNELYTGDEPIFDAFGIEGEIKRALASRVELPSGGYLVIDQAEALTAIDVNTGKFVGKGARDHEESIVQTNLEAVDEIAYQLRFRNIGGVVVLDLIDMDRPGNRRKVLAKLKENLQKDRAKSSVIRISEFGLLEMTRERTSDSLGRRLHEPCSYCDGTGQILSRLTVANEMMRDLRRRASEFEEEIEISLHPDVFEVFKGEGGKQLKEVEKRIKKKLLLVADPDMHHERYQLKSRRSKAGREAS